MNIVEKSQFDWSELAFASKKSLNSLEATFIAAPRELSIARFRQLLTTYLPADNVVIGLAREGYIKGFEDQPQFRTLKAETIQTTIDRINQNAAVKNKVYILHYAQANLEHILEKADFKQVILVNGSWQYTFHVTKPFYVLSKRGIPYELVSPFASETEAKNYAAIIATEIAKAAPLPKPGKVLTDREMMIAAETAGRYSYDYNFQIGVALGKRRSGRGQNYTLLATTHNKIIPYETYAMHHGAAREKHFSPPHDLNHYDTVHAEAELIIEAATKHIDLSGTSLFITLLPCPTCSRMIADTPIAEVVYSGDHSSGYGVRMLEAAGKTVRRLVLPE